MEKLTAEQEAQISIIVEKWRAIALSTEPIDRHKAASAIKSAYAFMGQEVPEIIFCDSPLDALNKLFLNHLDLLVDIEKQIFHKLENKRGKTAELEKQQRKLVIDYWDHQNTGNAIKNNVDLYSSVLVNVERQLYDRIRDELYIQASEQTKSEIAKFYPLNLLNRPWFLLNSELEDPNPNWLILKTNNHTLTLLYDCFWFDIYVSICNYTLNQSITEVWESLVKECGHIYAYEKICFVCDRPRIISFDNQQELHAEGVPAIQFADGYSLYAYHGVTLPEEYGKLHPHQWKAEWILEEKNAELRRVLIQGIGYTRICQELQATELDSWQEYTLLKIDKEIDGELMYLLKMTCPSTGHIHALRVPPDLESAREAIRWVNWGIDPEEFSVQT